MKICFLVGEIFAWGKYGGFGALTRKIGSELAIRGVEVFAVVPLGDGQKSVEKLDGITVFGYTGGDQGDLRKLLRNIDADVFHSEEPNIISYMAQQIHPNKKHIVTFQDPRGLWDWWNEFQFADSAKRRAFPGMLRFECAYHPLVRYAAQKSEGLYCQAKYISKISKKLYGLSREPQFLPNPVDMPLSQSHKSVHPTVCFLGRWDRRKRPWLFIELAQAFPDVTFLMMGKPDNTIMKGYPIPKNLQLLGLTQGKDKDAVLERSWALVNTSTRECLPVSFLEAASHRCAIISSVDPDDFATNFGFHVSGDNYSGALQELLDQGWQQKGGAGYDYVLHTHSTGQAIEQHLAVYKSLLNNS